MVRFSAKRIALHALFCKTRNSSMLVAILKFSHFTIYFVEITWFIILSKNCWWYTTISLIDWISIKEIVAYHQAIQSNTKSLAAVSNACQKYCCFLSSLMFIACSLNLFATNLSVVALVLMVPVPFIAHSSPKSFLKHSWIVAVAQASKSIIERVKMNDWCVLKWRQPLSDLAWTGATFTVCWSKHKIKRLCFHLGVGKIMIGWGCVDVDFSRLGVLYRGRHFGVKQEHVLTVCIFEMEIKVAKVDKSEETTAPCCVSASTSWALMTVESWQN